MSCISSFAGSVAGLINGSFKDDFIAELQALGVDPDTITHIQNNLPENVVNASEIEDSLNRLNISDKITSNIKSAVIMEKSVSEPVQEVYEPQNAIEGFSIPEPVIDSKVEVKSQDPIVYRPKKKWWERIYLDKIANLIKVDLKKFTVQMLHFKSKNQLKVDKDGNVTIYVKGDFKQVVEGNYALEVKGSQSVTIGGDTYLTGKGGYFVDIGKSYDLQVADKITYDAGSGMLVKCDFTVDGDTVFNSSLKVSGNTNLSTNLKVGANAMVGANLNVSGVAKASGHI